MLRNKVDQSKLYEENETEKIHKKLNHNIDKIPILILYVGIKNTKTRKNTNTTTKITRKTNTKALDHSFHLG